MVLKKSYISRIFLLGEIVVFYLMYFWGVDGLPKLYKIQEENRQLEQEIVLLNKEISELNNETLIWNRDPFYKEKVAREQLQMARESDEIFFI